MALVGVLESVGGYFIFLKETVVWTFRPPFDVRNVINQMLEIGYKSLPVTAVTLFFTGMVMALQIGNAMDFIIAGSSIFIGSAVTIAMFRELCPVLTALLLAGRVGSSIAAEIGTMKVTEEINALRTFGLSPTRFLVVTRVLASLIVTPMLSVFSTLMGIVGGYVVMGSLGYSLDFYVTQITEAMDYVDFLQGVAKSVVFALLVAGVGCLCGLRTQSGPGAVGDSTTRAVVAGIVLIVFADAILGTCFYYLGI
jgi:phospholipid/cholesterol/gamma-HCH transport system permease protein